MGHEEKRQNPAGVLIPERANRICARRDGEAERTAFPRVTGFVVYPHYATRSIRFRRT